VFIGCLAVELAGYRWLVAGLRAPESASRMRALKGWAVFAVAWQIVVFAGCVVYALALTHGRRPAGLWIAPPIGALVGTALPYQLVATRLMRGLTR
jgi:hypothetical protein